MSTMSSKIVAAALILSLAGSGCGMIMGTAMDTAGERIGESIGQELAAGMTVPMYRAYALSLMAAYFWAGGYWLAWHPYQPGDWTKWKHEVREASPGEGERPQPLYVEKAFLKRQDDGSEWWRIKALQENPEDTVVFETLFSADRTRIVRLLGRIGQNPVTEITFEEGEYAFPAPAVFEEQMLATHGAGRAEIAAAGLSWSANHVQFRAQDGSGQADFFFSPEVPGGLVKYKFTTSQGDSYQILLSGHGGGAASELGAY